MSLRARLKRFADGVIVLFFLAVGILCGCALEVTDSIEERLKQTDRVQRRG